MRFLVVVSALTALAGCGIAENDPLPNIGAPCTVDAGGCDLEHVCVPSSASGPAGVCAPVTTFGACDAQTKITHAPGRKGDAKDVTEIQINGAEDLGLLKNVRAVSGSVYTFKTGAPNVEIPDLCAFRALQSVGNGLGISDLSEVTALDGLQSMTSVRGALAIVDNNVLANLDGLVNLVDIAPRTINGDDYDVIIVQNPKLSDADVNDFINALEARVGRTLKKVACKNGGIGGRGCNANEDQVLAAIIANGLHG